MVDGRDDSEEQDHVDRYEGLFAELAIEAGKGVVDPGCADSMGGVEALEAVTQLRAKVHGGAQVRVVHAGFPPTYSFGDGEKGAARGQVKLGIAGEGVPRDVAIDRGRR